jgi:hypothetical protein|tara:strand:- start:293 stop:571 length:279 start_codon:yes stop_codon:yes gene_type:complete
MSESMKIIAKKRNEKKANKRAKKIIDITNKQQDKLLDQVVNPLLDDGIAKIIAETYKEYVEEFNGDEVKAVHKIFEVGTALLNTDNFKDDKK